jgi:hypothetical protein
MFTYLTRISLALKPFHKFTYILAIILIVNITYKLIFSVMPSAAESNEIMLNFLALAWLALVNLMVQVFSIIPVASPSKTFFIARIKNWFQRGFYYILFVVFILLSIAVTFLSFKMLRL